MYDPERVGAALFGRDRHRRDLVDWLGARTGATGSGPPVVLIGGEAGVGKTALVESVLAEWPAAVFRGAGRPWSHAPYGILRGVLPDGPPSPDAIAGAVRAALTDGGAPVVLFLDDVQWSDDTSLAALPAIADAVVDDPVAIIGVYRTDELPRGHLLRRVRAALRHARHLREMPLDALDGNALRELIANLVGAPPTDPLVAAISARTEGVPFFVEELLAALQAADRLVPDGDRIALAAAPDVAVPETVRDAILLRVAPFAPGARTALDIAAVLGNEFDTETVADLCGQSWPDELDHSGLLAIGERGGRRFRHALAEEAIYGDIPWPRRRAWHLLIADRLAARGAPTQAVARHLMAGRDIERARPALIAAADDHVKVYAYRDAARFLRMAIESWPAGADEPGRLHAVDRLARCAEAIGDHVAAVAALRELAESPFISPPPVSATPTRTARTAGSATVPLRDVPPIDAATIHRRLASQYELQGWWPLALAAREAAAAGFAARGDRAAAATERLAIAAHLRSAASFRAALDVVDGVLDDLHGDERADLIARAEGLRGNVLARMGRVDEGVATVHAALDRALRHGRSEVAAEIYQRLADSLEHAGDYRAATHAYDVAFAFCETRGDAATAELCRACATVVLFHAGQWDRATRLCREVLDGSTATAHARTVATGVLGLVASMRGQSVVARAALLDAHATAVRIDLVAMELLSIWGLALVEDAAGRTDRAAALYRTAVARARGTEERHYCVPVLQFAIGCFSAAGTDFASDIGAATGVLAAAAESTGQPEAQAALAYALAETAVADGAVDRAAGLFRHALDLLDGHGLPIIDSYVRLRAARAFVGTNDATLASHDEPSRLLGEAQRTMRRLRAGPLVAKIRAVQQMCEPGRGAAGPSLGDIGLTTRELEILRLVGQGETSREIGHRLFLSVRTVEMHVQHGMAKLGCRTRAAAVQRLAALDRP
jgi:DNA-binding CsgD family transcriptional regulator/tetratricopeptide (TPR) repeat protein